MKNISEKAYQLRKLAPFSRGYKMSSKMSTFGIRHFDELIHDQPREWLIKNFKRGATKYPVNVTKLMRNIIWQTRERIIGHHKEKRDPLKEMIRTFWYMHVKSTLSRAGALSGKRDQYKDLVEHLSEMVKAKLMRYKDIDFIDENKPYRKVGAFANFILFAEKLGHFDYLTEIADKYNVSIISLGGQSSLMSAEYFVDNLKKETDIRRSFFVYSIVDYDPSGWIIRDAFIDHLACFGVKNTTVVDLVHPDVFDPENPEDIKIIKHARVKVRAGKDMRVKNEDWLKKVARRHFENQKYLVQGKTLYGLEAESVRSSRLTGQLLEKMIPLIGKNEELLRVHALKELKKAIGALILHKLT